MKINFSFTIEGKDTIREKLKNAMKEDPALHFSIMQEIIGKVMKRLKIDESDDIEITYFNIGAEEPTKKNLMDKILSAMRKKG